MLALHYSLWGLGPSLLYVEFTGLWVFATLLLNIEGHPHDEEAQPPAATNGRYKVKEGGWMGGWVGGWMNE